jgi:hypothetical protein
MASGFVRTLILATLAIGLIGPVSAEESQQVVASISGATSDATLTRAMDIIRQSRDAQQNKVRRNHYSPSFDQKIVRSRHCDHVYILGGASALPM